MTMSDLGRRMRESKNDDAKAIDLAFPSRRALRPVRAVRSFTVKVPKWPVAP